MIPEKHQHVLKQLVNILEAKKIIWALTGSTAFALQGLPFTPDDIDIQTTATGAYAIEQLFKRAIVKPVRYSETPRIRSHFGALEIAGVKVEIMGDIQTRANDKGTWSDIPNIASLRVYITQQALQIPVLPLVYEYEAYLRLGRYDKAQIIKQALNKH